MKKGTQINNPKERTILKKNLLNFLKSGSLKMSAILI